MARSQTRQFFRPVGLAGDSIRIRATTERGRILAFTAQPEVWLENAHRPTERYESAHGRVHRDSLDWSGNVIAKHWLPEGLDLNDALTLAEQDLRLNALRYRAEFVRRKP